MTARSADIRAFLGLRDDIATEAVGAGLTAARLAELLADDGA